MADFERDEYYNNRTVYALSIEDLQPGDIILTKNVRSKSFISIIQSWIIRIATRSKFSHAMLYTTPPTAIEAIKNGVIYTSIQRTFFHNMKNVKVLRYENEKVAKNAAVWASRAVGQSYALSHAIKLVVPQSVKTSPPRNATFCSAMVIAAYQSTNQKEFLDLDPFRISPGDIERMNIFSDVTYQVSKPMLSPNNIEMMSPLDGDRKPSPMDAQTPIYEAIYLNTIDMINEYIEENKLACNPPNDYYSSLKFIFDELQKKSVSPQVMLDIDDTFFNFMVENKLEDIIRSGISHDRKEYARQLNELKNEIPDIDLDDTKKLYNATDKQIASRSRSIEITSFPEGISKSWDEYRKQQILLIEEFKYRKKVLKVVIDTIENKSAP